MYLSYWNLKEAPFQNVADPRFAYLSDQHCEGLARLVYLVQNRKHGGILAGPYGVGKSMVLELLAQEIRRETTSAFINFDYLPGTLISFVRQIFILMDLTDLLSLLQEPYDAITLMRQKKNSLKHTVLAIDEAQSISDPEVYRFLQLLTNITFLDRQRGLMPAFTLILAGSTDIHAAFATQESLCQRLQIVWDLEPLQPRQTVEYIQHRIRVAGGDIWLFDAKALDELAPLKGVPRLINNVCDLALMLGFAANMRQITPAIMQQAINESYVKSRGQTPAPSPTSRPAHKPPEHPLNNLPPA